MNIEKFYRIAIILVLLFIVLNIFQFRTMSDSFYKQYERSYLEGRVEQERASSNDTSMSNILRSIIANLDEQRTGFQWLGYLLFFPFPGILLLIYPLFANRRQLAMMDFYILIILFLVLPIVYSKDTKENFLLVKETHFRIFTLGLFALFIFRNVLSGRLMARLKEVPRSAVALLAIASCSLLWTINSEITIHFTAILLSYLAFYLVLTDSLGEKWQLIAICNVAVAMAALDSAYGILQYYGFDPLFGAGEVVGNNDRKRVFSFFGNPVFIGVYLDAVLPLSLVLFLFSFPLKGDYINRAEHLIARLSKGIIFFSMLFPPIYIAATKSALFSKFGSVAFAADTQKESQIISQIMWQSSKTTMGMTLLVMIFLFGALYALRTYVPVFKEYDRKLSQAFIGSSSFLFILACLFITFTRTAWIAMGFSLLCVLGLVAVFCNDLIYRYRRVILISLFTVLLLTFGLTINYFGANMGTESIAGRLTSPFTVLQRMMLFDISTKMWTDHFLLGAGWGTFGMRYPLYQEKFYTEGPFYLIQGANVFFDFAPVRFLLNFMIYLFFTLREHFAFLLLFGFYIFVALSLFILYITYFGLVKQRGTHLTVWAIMLIPMLLFMGYFYQDHQVKGNKMLAVELEDGRSIIYHGTEESAKTGEVLLNHSDVSGVSIVAAENRYLTKGEALLPPDKESYFWLAAGFAHAHNEYLQILTDIGLPGIFAFLALFFFFFRKAYHLITNLSDPAERLLVIGFVGCVIAGLVESLANFPYQRLTPVVMNCLAFIVIYRGRQLFHSHPESKEDRARHEFLEIETTQPKMMEAMAPAIIVLMLVVLPMNYAGSNVLLKSGHIRLMEAQKYYSDARGREIAPIFLDLAKVYLEEAVRRVPHLTEASFWYSDLHRMFGDQIGALRLFTETLKYGNNKNVYSSMGNTEYDLYRNESDPVKKEEHLNRAIANWEKTTRMNPNFAPPLKRLAHHYYMMGQMDSAEIYLKKSVRWDKGDMSSWKMYAQLLLKKEKNDEVLEALEFMRTLNKQRNGKPEGYYIQLAGLLVQRKRNSEAFTILNEYCGAFPTDLRAMTVFHRTALAMKNWEAARASLDKLYASKPEVKEFYIQKAMIYEQQEKYDKAYFELAMAYNKDTSDAQLRRMMEAMDHRRKK